MSLRCWRLLEIIPSPSSDPYMVLKYIGFRGFQAHSRAKPVCPFECLVVFNLLQSFNLLIAL
jgi:hypothetical protein